MNTCEYPNRFQIRFQPGEADQQRKTNLRRSCIIWVLLAFSSPEAIQRYEDLVIHQPDAVLDSDPAAMVSTAGLEPKTRCKQPMPWSPAPINYSSRKSHGMKRFEIGDVHRTWHHEKADSEVFPGWRVGQGITCCLKGGFAVWLDQGMNDWCKGQFGWDDQQKLAKPNLLADQAQQLRSDKDCLKSMKSPALSVFQPPNMKQERVLDYIYWNSFFAAECASPPGVVSESLSD